jgi:hypothetical protein
MAPAHPAPFLGPLVLAVPHQAPSRPLGAVVVPMAKDHGVLSTTRASLIMVVLPLVILPPHQPTIQLRALPTRLLARLTAQLVPLIHRQVRLIARPVPLIPRLHPPILRPRPLTHRLHRHIRPQAQPIRLLHRLIAPPARRTRLPHLHTAPLALHTAQLPRLTVLRARLILRQVRLTLPRAPPTHRLPQRTPPLARHTRQHLRLTVQLAQHIAQLPRLTAPRHRRSRLLVSPRRGTSRRNEPILIIDLY